MLFGGYAQLSVELPVEDGKNRESNEPDKQQYCAEPDRSYHTAHLGGYDRRDAKDGENAHTGNGHL